MVGYQAIYARLEAAYNQAQSAEVERLAQALQDDPYWGPQSLPRLAHSMAKQGRLSEAIAVAQRPEASAQIDSSVLSNLCWWLLLEGRSVEARATCLRGVAQNPISRSARINLAGYWMAAGDWPKAQAELIESRDLADDVQDLQASFGTDLEAYESRAVMPTAMLDQGRAWLKSAWPPAWTAVQGLAEARSSAKDLMNQGQWARALPVLQQAHAISSRELGPQHRVTAHVASQMLLVAWQLSREWARTSVVEMDSQVYVRQLEELIARSAEVLTLTQPNLPVESPSRMRLLWDWVIKLKEHGNFKLVLPLWDRLAGIEAQVLGEDHPRTQKRYSELAELLTLMNRPARAAPVHDQAVKHLLASLGPTHDAVAEAQLHRAQLQLRQGEVLPALATAERLSLLASRDLGTQQPVTRLAQITEIIVRLRPSSRA